ncbi:hypothetical protein NQ318_000222 [Aromia moschata]|uniref:Uncharacterized protein n=1 Tax=Aromia moschata TaxID=1265417 RepID=A0AAV8Y1A7_9CUCU|nr:hypothetical protein NQ318_000222 [Aromia moschata]
MVKFEGFSFSGKLVLFRSSDRKHKKPRIHLKIIRKFCLTFRAIYEEFPRAAEESSLKTHGHIKKENTGVPVNTNSGLNPPGES